MAQSDNDNQDLMSLALRDAVSYCNVLINEATTGEDKSAFEKRKILYKELQTKVIDKKVIVKTASSKDTIKGVKNDLHSDNKHSDETRNFSIAFSIDNSNRIIIQSTSCEPTAAIKADLVRDRTTNKSDGKRKVSVERKPTVQPRKKSGLRSKGDKDKSGKVRR